MAESDKTHSYFFIIIQGVKILRYFKVDSFNDYIIVYHGLYF